MSKTCEHKNPLQRDGSSQESRRLAALDPAFVQPDDRSADDLVNYASQLAQELHFYNLSGAPEGDWRNFLAKVALLPEGDWEKNASHEPHVALFLTFLKLFRHSQNHLNDLPGQHLDFFYKKVLRLQEKAEEPDRVHVVFELNKRIEEQKIEKNARLLAGKDRAGKPLFYQLEDDIIVNRAQVAHLRSVFNDNGQLRTALFANTKDGWGEAFGEPDARWPAFGHAGLPKAGTGLALASHMLLLGEGERWVTLTFQVSGAGNPLAGWDEEVFLQNLDIQASGEKGWLGPFPQIERSAGGAPVLTQVENGYRLSFKFLIPAGEKPVVPYNEAVLKEHYNTASPVVKIIFRQPAQRTLAGLRLDTVKIGVEVTGMKNLVLENDFGTMDAAKPFQPFGPLPRAGGSFYIGSEEVFTKNFTNLKLHVRWQDLPEEGFAELYKNYPVQKSRTNFTANLSVRGDGKWTPPSDTVRLFPDKGKEQEDFVIPQPGKVFNAGGAVLGKAVAFQHRDFRPVLFSRGASVKSLAAPLSLLRAAPFFVSPLIFFRLEPKFFNQALKEGFMRLTLNQNFGHNEFFRRTAEVAANNADPNKTKLNVPAPPYTPQIASIKLSYTAETAAETLHSVALDSEEAKAQAAQKFNSREIQFFHLMPFGHSEQHGYIRRHLDFLPSAEVTLLPAYPDAGEFYIGLENAEPLRTVSILFQLAEGSADPELPSQKLQWSLLCQNHWKPLNREHVLADFTNDFLKSGIIRFYLPKETSASNTLLDSGFTWLRATVAEHPGAVCQAIAIHAQAVRAVWDNQGNGDDHLATTLPASTIKKLEREIGTVKKVTQPYASFGGRPKEVPSQFYVRVSERLRHKNRAISIWDYEHLVLEAFPAVHKAKCLNHTRPDSEFSPGDVTVVLLPQLQNQNAVDILKPKFSAAVLREVEAVLKKLTSKFVTVYADNPDYEEVLVAAKVKFRHGFEAGFYSAQLSSDLVRFLTPWAFEQGQDVQFGGSIHQSRVIAFAEQLPYVDFLENFTMHHVVGEVRSANQYSIEPTNSKAILVSAKQHLIEAI